MAQGVRGADRCHVFRVRALVMRMTAQRAQIRYCFDSISGRIGLIFSPLCSLRQ